MMLFALFLATWMIGTLAGWTGHWALHQPWAGRFFKAHLTHHRLYPPKSLQSEQYREPGRDDTTLLLAPLIIGAVMAWLLVLTFLGVSWIETLCLIVLGAVVGLLHEWLHQAFHLETHWLDRFRWFKVLRDLHFEHHRSARVNLGVIWFGWDRLFKTFRK